jgi:hypothetical protein
MRSLVKEKAHSIYKHFSKSPILEMVQYLVNENVDAQVLNQLKLIDQKQHKNPYVTSYGEKVYAAYERICKILVTYPSLEFKNNKFSIVKDKDESFAIEYFPDLPLNKDVLTTIIHILNECLCYGVEAVNTDLSKISDLLEDKQFFNQLVTFLKEACGEDYNNYIKNYSK